jgi:VanZ family protein
MPSLKTAGRLAAWTCIAAIAALSLAPVGTVAMVRTDLGGHIEHAIAYAGTTFLAAAAYGRWRRVVAGLLVYAGTLEMLQHFSPGRTPSVVDYLFSAVGVVAGAAALGLLARVLPQARRD